jgi:hypothetical protein
MPNRADSATILGTGVTLFGLLIHLLSKAVEAGHNLLFLANFKEEHPRLFELLLANGGVIVFVAGVLFLAFVFLKARRDNSAPTVGSSSFYPDLARDRWMARASEVAPLRASTPTGTSVRNFRQAWFGFRLWQLALCAVVVVAAIIAILLAQRSSESPSKIPSGAWRHLALNPQPGWSSSGAWVKNSSAFLIVDAPRHIVRYYDAANGTAAGTTTIPALNSLYPTSDGYIASIGDRARVSLVWFSIGLVQMGPSILLSRVARVGAPAISLASAYQWTPYNGGILSVSDFEDAPNWFTALVHFQPSMSATFSLVTNANGTNDFRQPYLLPYPFLATLDGKAYYVLFDQTTRLCAFDGLVATCFSLVSLGRLDLLSDSPLENARKFESSSSIAGLYARGDGLYVLARRPDDQPVGPEEPSSLRPTTWTLWHVNLHGHRLFNGKVLPTHAQNLTVIPGPVNWAFVEKGTVEPGGHQEISSVVVIPSYVLEGPRE